MDYVLKGFQLSFVWDLRIQLVSNISFPKQDYMYLSTDGKFWIVTSASLRILEIWNVSVSNIMKGRTECSELKDKIQENGKAIKMEN